MSIRKEKRKRNIIKPYIKWSHEERSELISKRIENDALFTSKNGNCTNAWMTIAKSFDGSDKDYKICKQQWSNLMKKYKRYLKTNTGDGTDDDAIEDWPYFQQIHNYASRIHNDSLSLLEDRKSGGFLFAEPPISEYDYESASVSTSLSDSSPSSQPGPSTPNSRQRATNLTIYEQKMLKSNKKITKNLNNLISVFRQIVHQNYPNINVDSLLDISDSSDCDSN